MARRKGPAYIAAVRGEVLKLGGYELLYKLKMDAVENAYSHDMSLWEYIDWQAGKLYPLYSKEAR